MKDEDFLPAKIACALDRALTRPEILKYMKEQVIANTIHNLGTLTTEEVEAFYEESMRLKNDGKT